jgi:phospholipase D1/2
LGTVLGMAPGILVMSFLGHQLGRTLSNPSPAQLGLFVLGMAVWLLLSLGLQYAAGKLRSARHD